MLGYLRAEATGIVAWPADKYAPVLEKALGLANIGTLYSDEKLRTAIELMSVAQRANSVRSMFLTCITALEVLGKKEKKHVVVQKLLDDLNTRIEQQLPAYDAKSEERHALKSLKGGLDILRDISFNSKILRLFSDHLTGLSEGEATERSKEVGWAYDARNRLIHRGTISKTDLYRAYDIAYRALIDLLAWKIGIHHN